MARDSRDDTCILEICASHRSMAVCLERSGTRCHTHVIRHFTRRTFRTPISFFLLGTLAHMVLLVEPDFLHAIEELSESFNSAPWQGEAQTSSGDVLCWRCRCSEWTLRRSPAVRVQCGHLLVVRPLNLRQPTIARIQSKGRSRYDRPTPLAVWLSMQGTHLVTWTPDCGAGSLSQGRNRKLTSRKS